MDDKFERMLRAIVWVRLAGIGFVLVCLFFAHVHATEPKVYCVPKGHEWIIESFGVSYGAFVDPETGQVLEAIAGVRGEKTFLLMVARSGEIQFVDPDMNDASVNGYERKTGCTWVQVNENYEGPVEDGVYVTEKLAL